jgi:hypothetical protein
MTFTLNIPLTAADVKTIIGAGQTVTITQSNPTDVSNAMPVAWVAFEPFEGNQLTWETPVAIYASTSQLQSGVEIEQMSTSEFPATSGELYTFAENIFTGPTPNKGKHGTYYAQNANGETLTFGLTQSCSNNNEVIGGGPAPLSATSVLSGEGANWGLESTIWVYLSNVTNNGTVITSVSSGACPVTMLDDTPVTLSFDPNTNTFKVADSNSKAERVGHR